MKKIGLKIITVALFLNVFSVSAQIRYVNKAAQKGIDHIYNVAGIAGGVSFCDFDGDGWDDITLASEKGQKIAFYKNNHGSFEKLSPLVDHQEESKQILWVDYDNDGDKDLYVATKAGVNRLYKNLGNLNMIDVTFEAKLPSDEHNTFGACWGDYNRDGWVDLYYSERKIPIGSSPNENRLFLNNADGTFTEVTQQSNTQDPGKIPFCSSFFDFNNDHWPDIFTANDKKSGNTLLRNNKDGTFSDVSKICNADTKMDAMCVAIGDYDNNGWQDIYVSNIPDGNILLKNSGIINNNLDSNTVFSNIAEEAGVGFYGIGWGANFLDADNDTDLDLYVSALPIAEEIVYSKLYINQNDGLFTELESSFSGDTVSSFSNAIGDFNQDGYPDIVVQNNKAAKTQLWRNEGGNANWIGIKLEGVLSNKDGIGTKIEVYTKDQYQMRFTHCGIGFLAQNSNLTLIGLADNELIDSIRITWPTGHIDRLKNISAKQRITIVEGSTTMGEIFVSPEVNLVLVSNSKINNYLTKVNIFPNPANSYLQLKTDYSDFQNYKIYNVNGQILSEGKYSDYIDINYLPKGIYFIALSNSKGEQIIKKWSKI